MSQARKPFTADEIQVIVARYASGEGLVALAREHGCRYTKIKEIVESSGVVPVRMTTTNTPIELRLHDALRAAGVGFTTQVRLVQRYVVDIKVNQAPVVIEADGSRHLMDGGQRDAARDHAHESAGYRVFRFTGGEINRDAAACIHRVISECGLVPDEDPVYDVRTRIAGPDHPRWVGMHELTCNYCGETFESRRAQRKYCCHDHFILDVVKGKPKSADHGAKIAEANRQRVVTDETRAKISAARIGKPTTKGQPKSAETRAKISASLKGRKDSPETRAKKSESLRGNQNARRKDQTKRESDLRGDAQS